MSLTLYSANESKLSISKLESPAHFTRWKSILQDFMFELCKNTNMDILTIIDTLDDHFFSGDEYNNEFPSTVLNAARTASPTNVLLHEPLHPIAIEHALSTGKGFRKWLYKLFSQIKKSLSDDIHARTESVRRGDLVGLLAAIKLAVFHFESFSPEALEIEFVQCTMGKEGQNDVMTYTALLTQYMTRLEAAGFPVSDTKAQRVLLNGINRDIFEHFIAAAKRTPYTSYRNLLTALMEQASDQFTMDKLRALKPGLTHSLNITRPAADDTPRTKETKARMDRLEGIMTTIAANGNGGQGLSNKGQMCRQFARGHCTRGSNCIFSHPNNTNNNNFNGYGNNNNNNNNNKRNYNDSNNNNNNNRYNNNSNNDNAKKMVQLPQLESSQHSNMSDNRQRPSTPCTLPRGGHSLPSPHQHHGKRGSGRLRIYGNNARYLRLSPHHATRWTP